MFSAVGWICVEEAEYRDEFGDPCSLPRKQTLDAITSVMDELVPPLPFGQESRSLRRRVAELVRQSPMSHVNEPGFGPGALFRVDNGTWAVLINTHRNHRQEWPESLFRQVGQVAAGSFGFMHIWDDEHPTQSEQFMRWTMVLGRVDVDEEPLLRPVMRRWLAPFDGDQ
jgi:hypothetical protein